MFRRRNATGHCGMGKHHGHHGSTYTQVEEHANDSVSDVTIPIRQAPKDRNLKVISLLGASHFARRLAELGIGIGSTVRIVQAHRFGPIILDVAGSRIALGQGMTEKILVKVV